MSDNTVFELLARIYASANHYFDDSGRHCYRIPSTFTEAEHQQLCNAGVLPNQFITLAHDEAIEQLRQLAASVDLRKAADVFVASMVSCDLAWLTVLPATALGLALPEHDPEWMGGGSCRICFYDRDAVDCTEVAYFRHIGGSCWGEETPVHSVLALKQAAIATPKDAWPQPTPRDIWVFHQILDLLRKLPGATRYSKARSAIKDAKLLSCNTQSRCETLLDALAFIGVLETPEFPGMFTRFTTTVARDRRPNTRVEVSAPLAWWSAGDGINEALVARLFGHLNRPEEEPLQAVRPQPARRKPVCRASQPKSISGPVAAGDVYAVRYREDLWGAVYCHEVETDARGVLRGRVEFLDFLSPMPPTADQVSGIGYRDRQNGERWQGWCTALGKTTGVRRIAVSVPAPQHDQPMPERIPRDAASGLQHLAHWHFPEL